MKKYLVLFAIFCFSFACSRETQEESQHSSDTNKGKSIEINAPTKSKLNQTAFSLVEDAKRHEEKENYRNALTTYSQALRYFEQTKNDTMILKVLENTGFCYWELHEFEKATSTFLEQLKWIEKTKQTKSLPACYNNLGLNYYLASDYLNAIKYYGLSINEFRETGNRDQLATGLLNFGILLKNQGIYEDALKLLFEAEQYLWKAGESKALASCYEAIGLVNHHLQEYDEAINYHRQALEIRINLNYIKGIANSFNNLGLELIELNALDSALVYFKKSIKLKESLNNPQLLISTIENIGIVYERSDNYQVAEQYFLKGIELAKKYNDSKYLASLYHLMSKLKLHKDQFNEASNLLNKAQEQIKVIHSRSLFVENLKLKKDLFSQKGDYFQSLNYANQFIAEKDSLLNYEKNNSIAQLKVLHQVEKKEQENILLKQEAVIEKDKYYYTIVIATLMLVLLIVSIYLALVKNKTAKQEKLLRKEINHRTKNNFQLFSAILTLQADSLEDEVAVEVIKRNEGRINAMATIHQKLYQHEEKQRIDMHGFISEIIEYLGRSYSFSSQNIRMNLNIEHLQMEVSKAIPLGLIMNEVITNAFKYAFSNNPHPEISILLHQKGKKTELIVQDNGPGMSGDLKNKETSFGNKLIKLLSKQLKGKYLYKYDNGTKFELLI